MHVNVSGREIRGSDFPGGNRWDLLSRDKSDLLWYEPATENYRTFGISLVSKWTYLLLNYTSWKTFFSPPLFTLWFMSSKKKRKRQNIKLFCSGFRKILAKTDFKYDCHVRRHRAPKSERCVRGVKIRIRSNNLCLCLKRERVKPVQTSTEWKTAKCGKFGYYTIYEIRHRKTYFFFAHHLLFDLFKL